MASPPTRARKNPYKLRKFDPVRHVSVGGMSGPMKWQPPVSNQEPTRMAGIPRTKPSIASTTSLLFAMERAPPLSFQLNRLISYLPVRVLSPYLAVSEFQKITTSHSHPHPRLRRAAI